MPAWRPMRAADLAQVEAVAAIVHPDYPEDAAVLAERLALAPAFCHVLAAGDVLRGYAIAHPWHDRRPPALNSLLGAIPDPPGCTYIHDVALLPEVRRGGHGGHILRHLLASPTGMPVCLVAVGASVSFWVRHGFLESAAGPSGRELQTYGRAAVFMRRA